MAFLVGSAAPGLQRLAVPFASLLIALLGYGSQWLFAVSPDLEPGPLTPTQSRVFNTLLGCLWWTYWRACTVDPGRYEFPRSSGKKGPGKSGRDEGSATLSSEDEDHDEDDNDAYDNHTSNRGVHAVARRRWCRKCAAPKPPRAHHCKTCGRCIPKMDHHCPWTGNCVSLQTFPHFMRFIIYTNVSLWTLGYFLSLRFTALWGSRNLPAYLGPTPWQLMMLTALCMITFFTSLALGILLVTAVRGWLFNITMIEGWEIERHEAVLQRGGYEEEDWWRTSDGDTDSAPRSMVDPVEFPYDIGVYTNMAQAMGTSNPLSWLLPFAGGPRIARLPSSMTSEDLIETLDGTKAGNARLGTGWFYEENGLNDRDGMWPPVDPEKVRNARLWRQRRQEERKYRLEQMQGLRDPALPDMNLSPEEEKEAFRRRQERDLQRWRATRAEIINDLEEIPASASPYQVDGEGDYDFVDEAYSQRRAGGYPRTAGPQQSRRYVVLDEGKSGWVNADGEHLGDYGVDEDAEFDDDYVYDGSPQEGVSHIIDPDDDEVPLAELIRRRKIRTKDGEDI
ncbi:zf-DHHC-domain-containing protein [Xylaria bambusicola]|uniref:zf-DHHC-domain-containing protein n=1 Tax=Xylaria bambusicola TaxID=326684 RepID=UPI0020075F7E|nr:zf-DHHC-domain-containing protein [Xylaria bambusicola]KAI0503039.1 zf-DHHC-domain-containing protein [Xylaria bambusicola]